MAYNTGNPVGSADPRDLKDNAPVLDALVNSKTHLTYPDRLGQQRKTWAGIEQLTADLEAMIAANESAAQLALTQVAASVIKTQTMVIEHHAFT